MRLSPVFAPEIFALRPDFAALCLLAQGSGNGPSNAESDRLLAEAVAEFDAKPWAEGHVAAWRGAYRSFGAKPKRTPCSLEALLKRARRDGQIRPVNAAVDLYNAISLRYAIPVGGEDAERIVGHPTLRRATGPEPFETMAEGSPKTLYTDPGEVIWCDDAGVTCRRWNWRQGTRTQIREDSSAMWFVLERLEPMPLDALPEACAELVAGLRLVAGNAKFTARLFHRENPDGEEIALPLPA